MEYFFFTFVLSDLFFSLTVKKNFEIFFSPPRSFLSDFFSSSHFLEEEEEEEKEEEAPAANVTIPTFLLPSKKKKREKSSTFTDRPTNKQTTHRKKKTLTSSTAPLHFCTVDNRNDANLSDVTLRDVTTIHGWKQKKQDPHPTLHCTRQRNNHHG